MSSQDFNNGFITGLAMKGIPYGVAQSWQPESISNDDTESITIDFGRHIPEVEIENYIDALYFTATYIQSQYLIEILGWERINDTTIKFLTTNYFSCNGVVNIMYNTKQGNLDALPSFVVNYYPDGVPILIYRKFENLRNVLTYTLPTVFAEVRGEGTFTTKFYTPVTNNYNYNSNIANINLPLLTVDFGQSISMSADVYIPE